MGYKVAGYVWHCAHTHAHIQIYTHHSLAVEITMIDRQLAYVPLHTSLCYMVTHTRSIHTCTEYLAMVGVRVMILVIW